MSEAPPPARKRLPFNPVAALIVIALLGIIVAIPIPAYGDYTPQQQASEALGLMAAAKTPLAAHFEKHGQWPGSLDPLVAATSGNYTRSVAISSGAGGKG